MTDAELNIKIAEKMGVANQWVIVKRGLYYRPNARGYTANIEEAWKVTSEEADKHVCPHDEPITKKRAPIPDYCNDLNAMHEAEATLNEEQRRAYFFHLFGSQRLDDGELWKAVHATARQRAEAFARVFNLI